MDTGKWISQIDETTHLFENNFGELTNEQLNWKPSKDSWSIAQNIEHLITINESYEPVIESVLDNTYKLPFVGKIGFLVTFFGSQILKSVNPDRRKKMKTFPMWQPRESSIPEGVLERFVEHQSSLKELINSSEGLLDQDTVISSPANKNIVYKLETAFDIIVTHERRHFEQAKEVMDILKTQAEI